VHAQSGMLQLLSVYWIKFDFARGYLLEKGYSSSWSSVEEVCIRCWSGGNHKQFLRTISYDLSSIYPKSPFKFVIV